MTSVPRVLLAGVSMRAVAASAIRAGFEVAVVDAFADLDLPSRAQAVALPASGERFDVPAAVRAARHVRADAAVYGSAFENCPRGVAALSRSRTLWGNAPDVLRRVRRPATLFETFAAEGLAVPPTRPPGDVTVSVDAGWLRKPLRSGGGRDIRPWTGGPIPADSYLQQPLAGVPGSIVFTAANGTSQPLLVSRQIVGDRAFGATGYRYCGSIASRAGDLFGRDEVAATAASLASVAAGAFGLVGVNGLDFVVGADAVWPLEVNPRWCASIELVERAGGPSVFAAHVAACTGARRETATPLWPAASRAFGKAIVFARAAVVAGDTRPWLVQPDIADVPRPGVHIPAGGPICTVFAEAGDAAACYDALVHCAGRVYAEAGRWRPPEADRPKPTLPEARIPKPEALP